MTDWLSSEIAPDRLGDASAESLRMRQGMRDRLSPLTPAIPGDRIPLTGILGVGTYKGGTVQGFVDLTCTAGAKIEGDTLFDASGIVRGLRFNGAVSVSATGRMVFTNCRFFLPITVAAGGRVTTQSCTFDGTSAILNAGLAANAFSNGNVKLSATAHTNVTIISEV